MLTNGKSHEQAEEPKSAEDEYNEVSGNFEKVAKRILIFKTDKNRKVPTDKEKVLKYKTDIVEAYNNFIEFIARVFESQNTKTKEALHRDFDNVHKPKLLECLKVLKLTAQVPRNFLSLDINTIVDVNTSQTSETAKQITEIATSSATQDIAETLADIENETNSIELPGDPTVDSKQLSPTKLTDQNNGTPRDSTMPQSKQDFLKMAASVLNYKYDADPLRLESFLADVEIVEAMAEAEQNDFCLKFIKAKLDQKALEHLPEEIKAVKDITDALRNGIKVESSEVVEGKMLALRVNRGNYTALQLGVL